jgi:hypothetical protein
MPGVFKSQLYKAHDAFIRMRYCREENTMQDFFYSIQDIDLQKNVISMERFRGKVLLVINVASK